MKLRPSANLEDAPELGPRLLSQAFDIWVTPEIERRRAGGQLQGGVAVNAFQIIMPSPRENGKDVVRINDEVRAIVRCKPNIDIAKGELVRVGQIDEISGVKLTEDEDPNSGHMTGLNLGGQWFMGFDFRRDKAHAKQLLVLAREFYATAIDSLGKGRLRPAIENLFAAAELAAKAELLVFCFFPYQNRKDHGAIRGSYGKWMKAMNAPTDGNTALNKLSRLRAAARYGEGNLETAKCRSLVDAVNVMMTHAEEEAGRF